MRSQTSRIRDSASRAGNRAPSVGEGIASAQDNLLHRIAEARDTIDKVLATLPNTPSDSLLPRDPPRLDSSALSPLDEARMLLNDYLAPFKAAVFNGRDSIKLAASGNRLKKVSRRLHEAVERAAAARRPVDELGARLAASFPGQSHELHAQTAATVLALREWDERDEGSVATADSLSTSALAQCAYESIVRNGRVQLTFFVCCPVDFRRLSSPQPEQFLRTTMHGSVLSRLVARLRTLFQSLEGARLPIDLLAIVGDTDEEDYIWRVTPRPESLHDSALNARRDELVESIRAYLTELISGPHGSHPRVASAEVVRVERLSAMTPSARARDVYRSVAEDPFQLFDHADLDAELEIMRGLWRPDGYYQGLPAPDTTTLKRIIAYKFATYAMQGILLYERDPSLVLVQTERPSLLRAKMLNAGRRRLELPPLPMVNFFAP